MARKRKLTDGGLGDLTLPDLTLPDLTLPDLVPDADPLAAVDYTGDVEQDAEAEMSELLKGFKARSAAENKRFVDATDSEFWVALCFQNREQKEAFLNQLGLLPDGDKYLDGQVVAKRLKIALPKTEVSYREAKISPDLVELT